MKRLCGLILLLVPFLGTAQELSLDTEKATVSFLFVAENTSGTVGGIDASISLNLSDLSNSTVQGTADVSTLTTKNKMRDKHLKSSDYFDAAKYPQMKFKSTSITKKGDTYYATGTLTIKGVSKSVTFSMKIVDDVLVLKTTINAADYGVSPKKKENSAVEVTINIPLAA